MNSAYAYLRVSGKSQVNGDGFPRQLKAIRDYAAAHDIKIAHVFREEGVSGTVESLDRPAWSELMAMLHSNGVRTILIEKLDRLARDLMVQEAAIADLGAFMKRWPQVVRALITQRYPMERYQDLLLGKVGGIKNVISIG